MSFFHLVNYGGIALSKTTAGLLIRHNVNWRFIYLIIAAILIICLGLWHFSFFPAPVVPDTVSYTHLDVYKRQTLLTNPPSTANIANAREYMMTQLMKYGKVLTVCTTRRIFDECISFKKMANIALNGLNR